MFVERDLKRISKSIYVTSAGFSGVKTLWQMNFICYRIFIYKVNKNPYIDEY
jgi:hypothetical protein